ARSIVGSRALIGKGTRVTDCVIGCGYQVQELQRINNRVIQDDAHIGLISAEAIAPVSDSSSIPV
ncbi:MAG TPA: hypothetical protein PLZ21_12175, partial [Armatimonadota bacterium]|nr:hypothetical protein [Armatimonadota bacterium]